MTATTIGAWENDPGAPNAPYTPIARPKPQLDAAPLPLRIAGSAPRTNSDQPGTPAFRYWATAEALRRASDMWGATIGAKAAWYTTVGKQLKVTLDQGVQLNAFYDRKGLHFFHASVDGATYYSSESPDVACHEHGHAVLDSLRPELFDTPFIEGSAFHEAFGDMSAMLAALQLTSVRKQLIAATGGRIHRNSTVSRLAEQLGWAIRQGAPDEVDRDALRNASHTWFYRDPSQLPPSAPASQLSSEPHSFSRVFSGAFLTALSGMLLARGKATADALLQVTSDARQLLRDAVADAPIVPAYMSQVAAHMVAVDAASFGGIYRDALTGAFVKHGILSVPSATALTAADGARLQLSAASNGRSAKSARAASADGATARLALPREAFGLSADLIVEAPRHVRRFRVSGATPDLGSVEHPSVERATQSFVEDLIRRGRIDFGAAGKQRAAFASPLTAKTHELREAHDGYLLARRLFHCGFSSE
jgi:hypothetical protein